MSTIARGLSVIAVTGVLAGAGCTASTERLDAFVGRWTMDTGMYVESLREQQEKLAPAALENYTRLAGSEEAGRERLQKLQERQLDRARRKELQFDLGADGTFTGRSDTKSPRGPTDFQGRWIAWPKGVILFDTEVLQPGMKEPSPALGWILAMESVSQAAMRLYAGRLGMVFRPGLEFAGSDQSATGRIDVPVASAGADSSFAGTWRYDTKTVAERYERIRQRVRGATDGGNALAESMARSRLDLTLDEDGKYVLEAVLPDPDGEQKRPSRSGAWYGAGDVVVCIGELESPPSGPAGSKPPHRTAFVLRRTGDGGVEHVAGIMPVLNAQPPVPLYLVE